MKCRQHPSTGKIRLEIKLRLADFPVPKNITKTVHLLKKRLLKTFMLNYTKLYKSEAQQIKIQAIPRNHRIEADVSLHKNK